MNDTTWLKDFRAAILVVAAILTATTMSALAAEPLRETEAFQFSFTVDCGSFDAAFTSDVTRTSTTYYDQTGTAVRVQELASSTIHFTNLETGKTITGYDRTAFSADIPVEENVNTIRGVDLRLTIPGQGVVILSAGRLKIAPDGTVIFAKGKAMPEDIQEIRTKVCAALASA